MTECFYRGTHYFLCSAATPGDGVEARSAVESIQLSLAQWEGGLAAQMELIGALQEPSRRASLLDSLQRTEEFVLADGRGRGGGRGSSFGRGLEEEGSYY